MSLLVFRLRMEEYRKVGVHEREETRKSINEDRRKRAEERGHRKRMNTNPFYFVDHTVREIIQDIPWVGSSLKYIWIKVRFTVAFIVCVISFPLVKDTCKVVWWLSLKPFLKHIGYSCSQIYSSAEYIGCYLTGSEAGSNEDLTYLGDLMVFPSRFMDNIGRKFMRVGSLKSLLKGIFVGLMILIVLGVIMFIYPLISLLLSPLYYLITKPLRVIYDFVINFYK